MTSPQDQADALGDRLVRLERQAQSRALGRLEAELTALTRQAVAAMAVSPDAWQAILARLVAILEPVGPRGAAALQAALAAAWQEGLESAAAQVDLPAPLPLPVPDAVDDIGRIVDEQIAAVRALVRSNEDVLPAIAVGRRTVNRVESAATWHVNKTAGEAVTGSARELGLWRRWVAERDACLHCLAYQGEITAPDAPFPGGLTFADRPQSRSPIDGTPLHPNCRCIIQMHDPADTMVVTALKREARRSVLKGWSLPSESEPERLRAADRLLARGAGLPETVEKAARRAVKRGAFTSRDVP